MKASHDMIEFSAKLYNHFFARSLRVKGTKCNLIESSPNCGILIMRDTFSNFLMKKYASSDSRSWYLWRVLMNCGFILKLFLSSSGTECKMEVMS